MLKNDFEKAIDNLPAFRKDRWRRGDHADEHHAAALRYAQVAYENDNQEEAEVWALRALHDGPSCAALMLLANICEATNDLVNAQRWLQAAQGLLAAPARRYEDTSSGTDARTREYIDTRLMAIARLLREQWRLRDQWATVLETPNKLNRCSTLTAFLAAPPENRVYVPCANTAPAWQLCLPPDLDALAAVCNLEAQTGLGNVSRVLKLPARALAAAHVHYVYVSDALAARLEKLPHATHVAIDKNPALLARHIDARGWGLLQIDMESAGLNGCAAT